MSKAILLCFVITYFSFPVANGELLCYSCIMNAAETDRACEENPAAVTTSPPTVKCQANSSYCQIKRLEYSDHPGQIFTFFRGCTNDSFDGVKDGGGFNEFFRVCTTDLCNDWDGISSGRRGGGGGGGGGGGSGGSGGGGGGGNGGSGGSGGGNIGGRSGYVPCFGGGAGPTGAGNQRMDLYVAIITFNVVINLYR